MTDVISVIISTLNPDIYRLQRALDGLKNQTMALEVWQLIIVNNNPSAPIPIDLSWHPNSLFLTEPKTGLTHARMKGFSGANGDLIVMVDDDNVLDENYLSQTLQIFKKHEQLGAIGGKSVPDFESEPPVWLKEFYGSLALRDLGNQIIISNWSGRYPEAAPIGAGMAIRKAALQTYIHKIKMQDNPIADRQGSYLGSGGDNDIVLEILKAGWQTGYFPSLSLKHIIPRERMQVAYLARLVNNTDKSWIKLLNSHQINPWPGIPGWTVPFRKIKTWFTYKAWINKINYIKWKGACGTFDALSELMSNDR